MITHIDGEQNRFRIRLASASASGGRLYNEDAMGVMDLGHKGLCCALADGAGGHGNGALAAQLTVDAVLNGFRETPIFAPAGLASLISQAEHLVRTEQPTSISRLHMSATVVLLQIHPISGRALWAHWGDSRLYCFRDNKVHLRTEDHSVVQQLLDAGVYQAGDDVRHLPNRNVLAGAIGAEGLVPPTVLSQALELRSGDAFLLCSDGLWENLLEADMEEMLQQSPRPDGWINQMLGRVLSMQRQNQDNLSAMAIWIDDSATSVT